MVFFTFTCNPANASSLKNNNTNNPIPILIYHSVTDNNFTSCENMFLTPDKFNKQLEMIIQQGFTPIFANEIKSALMYKNPIILTFDDGYIDNYKIVYPIIKKQHVKITIFIITDFLNREHYLTSDYVREMSNSGLVSIQSHTVSHKRLSTLDDTKLEKELKDSKSAILNLVKAEPLSIAYPYGSINENQLKLVSKYYQFGFTTTSGVMSNGNNNYLIKRSQVNKDTDALKLYIYLNSFKSNRDLFMYPYLAGVYSNK